MNLPMPEAVDVLFSGSRLRVTAASAYITSTVIDMQLNSRVCIHQFYEETGDVDP